ncbi:AMP-binding protein [Sphingobium sp.]|uniref:AMP-binding protein n=1 Tax=Sphingobium sp. TaxID=1912891 RepID=UPI003BB4BCA0
MRSAATIEVAASNPKRQPGQTIGADELSLVAKDDGTIYLHSNRAPAAERPSMVAIFDETAERWPDRRFLLQRETGVSGWRAISYGEAEKQSRSIAQWLLNEGIEPGETVAILSKPSIEHGVLMIGAQRVRVATAPINPAYSLIASDFAKLIECFDRTGAKLAFVDDATAFAKAIQALEPLGIRFIAAEGMVEGIDCARYADVIATVPTAQVAVETAAITPQTIARIMHTSGSTGSPKAAPLPQANLTQTVAQCEAMGLLELGDEQPQFLESMPFNHIMGGNYNFNNMIRLGAALHLDEGKPTPALFEKTLDNLRTMSPHIFHTVPAGFVMLCDILEADAELRERFYRNLVYMGCGGAVLPLSVTQRINAMSVAMTGREIPIFGLYGATEYSLGAVRYWSGPMEVIGLPPPGVALKLVPTGPKLELRVRAATVMPPSGYLGNPAASEGLFDDEGYFRTGDAMRFYDRDRPHLGLVFDGRIAEEFKLLTGTWVSVGILRSDILSECGSLLHEAVICGLNEAHVSALLWLNEHSARAVADDHAGALSFDQLARHPDIVDGVSRMIHAFNGANKESSRRIRTAMIMPTRLSPEQGEVTDKGSVNQGRVRDLRSDAVAALFAQDHPSVLRF